MTARVSTAWRTAWRLAIVGTSALVGATLFVVGAPRYGVLGVIACSVVGGILQRRFL